MANTVQCPACSHSWPVAEKDVGQQKCPRCNVDLDVTRVPVTVAWSYEAVEVTAVKAEDEGKRVLALKRLRRGGPGDPPRRL